MRHHRAFRNLARKRDRFSSNHGPGLSRTDLTILSFLLILVLSVAVYARADDQIRAVRLSNVVGSVQILAGTETQFSQAYPNMPLMQGSTLKTGEDGRAEVQLEDGSMIRLTPNSSVAMTVLGRDSQGNSKTEVDLLTGLSYVEMKGTANQRFVVHFNGNEVISPAPVKFRVNLDANPVEFAVLDGSAHLSNGTAYALDVHANETVRFDPGDSTRYLLAQSVDPDSWDQWNVDRDQAMNQMAARETREAIGSGNAGAAGISDLDYYGNWYSSNGTSFWVPDGAGAGWDPYGSGYWGNYGGSAGYVWISGYPWGWLPYRCGSWNYFNSFNQWGWMPTNCWNNGGYGFYPYSGIGNAPPRYRRLPRPNPIGHPVPGGGLHPAKAQTLIAVDRGPEATTLTPRLGAAPKTVDVGEGTAHLLPKTPNPTVLAYNRSERPVAGQPTYERAPYGLSGGQQLGNVPVYRPTAPIAGNRSAAPSFSSYGNGASASRSTFSSAPSAAGSFHGSAPSAPSAPSTPSGGSSSAGGGHPK
jgi:ferric-dicitrate binding protein FerR (iron transport regulator)